jgi:hypothetical protein
MSGLIEHLESKERHPDVSALRRIERAHAVVGALAIAGSGLVAGPRAALSIATGFVVIASSLWMWKRLTLGMLHGGAAGAGLASVGMLGKTFVTFGGVLALFRYLDIDALLFLLGTSTLPAACVAAAAWPAPARLASC